MIWFGSVWEFTSSFINNGYKYAKEYAGTDQNMLLENTQTTKYKTIYSNDPSDNGAEVYNRNYSIANFNANSGKRGDCIFEIAKSGFGNEGFNTNSSVFPAQDIPFLVRGGDFSNNINAGLFSFSGVSRNE